MFGFLKRQPPSNQLLMLELEQFRSSYKGPTVFDGIAADVVVKVLMRAVKKDANYAEEIIYRGGWSARDAVYTIISECAASSLRSGNLHSYRGTLSDQGRAYLRLYQVCIGGLVKSGRCSHQDGIEQLSEIEEAIARSG